MTTKHSPYSFLKIPDFDSPKDDFYLVKDGHGNFVAKTYSFDTAQLIAAAPEMLNVLKHLAWNPRLLDDVDYVNQIKDLIAKADESYDDDRNETFKEYCENQD